MPQIRLTSKAIKALKYPCLNDISRDCEFFDDWYFDILHINKKKVYLFMHLETKVAFAMPSFEIGGIKDVFECFALLLRGFFYEYGSESLAERVYSAFKEDNKPYFIKNTNRSMVPYSTQFKHIILYNTSMGYDLDQKLCDIISEKWSSTPIAKDGYIKPLELMNNLISQNSHLA